MHVSEALLHTEIRVRVRVSTIGRREVRSQATVN